MENQESSWAEHKVSRWDKILANIPFHWDTNESGRADVIAKSMKSFQDK